MNLLSVMVEVAVAGDEVATLRAQADLTELIDNFESQWVDGQLTDLVGNELKVRSCG